MATPPPPVVKKLDFGKIRVVIHEIVAHVGRDGRTEYRCTYHITDHSTSPPIKTGTAWVFFKEPVITPRERVGKTPEQIKRLWARKFVDNLKEALKQAIAEYRANREVFRL